MQARNLTNKWLSFILATVSILSLLLLLLHQYLVLYTHHQHQGLGFQPQRPPLTWNYTTRAVQSSWSFRTSRAHTRSSWWILYRRWRIALILSSFPAPSRTMFSPTTTKMGPPMLPSTSDPATSHPLFVPSLFDLFQLFSFRKWYIYIYIICMYV